MAHLSAQVNAAIRSAISPLVERIPQMTVVQRILSGAEDAPTLKKLLAREAARGLDTFKGVIKGAPRFYFLFLSPLSAILFPFANRKATEEDVAAAISELSEKERELVKKNPELSLLLSPPSTHSPPLK